jgi:hypothetical protein
LKLRLFLIIFVFSFSIFLSKIFGKNNVAHAFDSTSVYLPLISKSEQRYVLLGLYPTGWMGDQKVIDSQLHSISNWSGKRISIAGTFIGITEHTEGGINLQLNKIYENGYTPFINIMTNYTAEEYSSGKADFHIIEWAKRFKNVVSLDERIAYIALMPEMNGFWVRYGNDPENYIKSLKLTQRIFREQGVPEESVKWVFAPNGWSYDEHKFENYYPGDGFVDIVSFSSYNFGYCPAQAEWPGWISMQEAVEPYVERFNTLAPDKPIFLAQTGTTAFTGNGLDENAKNQWLKDGYSYLAEDNRIRAIIYFNIEDDKCDLAIYRTWETQYAKFYNGYKEGVQSSVFRYFSPAELKNINLSP